MPSGGSRLGAGRPRRHGRVERAYSVDIRPWARHGLLREGMAGVVEWTDDADSSAELPRIRFHVQATAVSFVTELDGHEIRQRVILLRGGYRFGGVMPHWFGCPGCATRVALLYLGRNGLACRRCHGLAYLSQSVGPMTRAARSLREIEQRLGPLLTRPPRMRLATYLRLLFRVLTCDQRMAARAAVVVASLNLATPADASSTGASPGRP
jgi:hypothetical protein